MKNVWIAVAACALAFASSTAHAKSACDVHHLGYTKAQCDECTNMTWSVSRVFPNGTCVASPPPAASRIAPKKMPVHAPAPPATPAKMPCDIHHLGYTKAECDKCSNMRWNVTVVTPKGQCASTAAPQQINLGGASKGGGTMTAPAPQPTSASCTLTNWGGATLPLNAPNFSMTGARVTACAKGYDLMKSKLHCSTGVPATPVNAPTTNVTCDRTTGVGGNTQVTINGQPCCLH